MSEFKIIFFFQFVILILLQVLILDHIHFLGYINPYLYLAFIIFLPLKTNRMYVLILSFLLGLSIDIFNDSGGVHAGASVAVAYLQPLIVRLSFGINYDLNTIKLNSAKLYTQISFILIMVFVHHLIMFSLSYFSINYAVEILKNTIFSGIFSSVLIFITLMLTKKG
jgi:rod shape-determining protein MreD